jgi:hypothetical protein
MKCKGVTITFLLFVVSSIALDVVGANSEYVSTTVDQGVAVGVDSYWTVERMRNAHPYPMPSLEKPAQGTVTRESVKNPADGDPGVMPGAKPGGGESGVPASTDEQGSSEEGEGRLSAASAELEAFETQGYTLPFPFTMYEENNALRNRYPNITIGRIFFTTSSGFDSSCSGASIGGRAVLTAGHCVSDGSGNWHRNWLFRPGYRDTGAVVQGQKWVGTQAITFTAWHTGGSYCRDVGFIITRDKPTGTLSQVVGALGHAWNWDASHQHWSQFGYPAERTRTAPEYLFNGTKKYVNEASFAEYTADWWTPGFCTPEPVCFGSYMTGGASGGPEILRYDPTGGLYPNGGNWANGVTSTYYLAGRVAGGICMPYFDTAVHDIIVLAQGL